MTHFFSRESLEQIVDNNLKPIELYCDHQKLMVHEYIVIDNEAEYPEEHLIKAPTYTILFKIDMMDMYKLSYNILVNKALYPNYYYLKKKAKTRKEFKQLLKNFIISSNYLYQIKFSFKDLNKIKLYKYKENPFDLFLRKKLFVDGHEMNRFNVKQYNHDEESMQFEFTIETNKYPSN